GVQFLRTMATDMGLGPGEAVIRYSMRTKRSQRTELVTAIPHTSSGPKRALDGTCRPQEQQCRWVCNSVQRNEDGLPAFCTCKDCDSQCPCVDLPGKCNERCHGPYSTNSTHT